MKYHYSNLKAPLPYKVQSADGCLELYQTVIRTLMLQNMHFILVRNIVKYQETLQILNFHSF